MRIPILQVDAFAPRLFAGNPAAVCPLESWLPDAVMQSIAAENNLAETAFFVPIANGYHLRWFTPKVEVDLCGHATLASAAVILEKLTPTAAAVRFETRSGELRVTRDGELYTMDFPSRPPSKVEPDQALVEGLGGNPIEILASRDYLAAYPTAADVLALNPDMSKLADINRFAAIATAPGEDCDFVSRFFAPNQGVPEDPVTGSAHCTLVPYWAAKLGKTTLFARQISERGGELWCRLEGDRVFMSGRAVFYLEGHIEV